MMSAFLAHRHVLNWTDYTITQIQSEPLGCWGCFAQKSLPCWIIFHGQQWRRHFPKSFEAFATKSGGNTKQSSFHPQKGSGMNGFHSDFYDQDWCVCHSLQFVQTPFDLFSSFYPSVVPSVYTIYMGKDKYESKYINVMMLNGLDLDLWGF